MYSYVEFKQFCNIISVKYSLKYDITKKLNVTEFVHSLVIYSSVGDEMLSPVLRMWILRCHF